MEGTQEPDEAATKSGTDANRYLSVYSFNECLASYAHDLERFSRFHPHLSLSLLFSFSL